MVRPKVTVAQVSRITDPYEMPTYGIPEAAHYLRLPPATLRSWVLGRRYRTEFGTTFSRPVIVLPDDSLPLLSFYNLAEAHVLSAFRREHNVKLEKIRTALDYVIMQFGWTHPLIEQKFETDGARLFIEKLDGLVDASARGQLVMDHARAHFQRLQRDEQRVVRLWPFTRNSIAESPETVFIDPRISFGRPCLVRCNIPTAVIAERYKAGEAIDSLAEDYGCDRLDIEEGLRCELDLKVAA